MHVVWIDSDVHRLVLKDRRVGPDLDGEAPFITQVYVDELLRADELNDPNSAMGVALRCRWHQAQILRPRSEHHPLARMHSVGEMTKRHSGVLARERRSPVFQLDCSVDQVHGRASDEARDEQVRGVSVHLRRTSRTAARCRRS